MKDKNIKKIGYLAVVGSGTYEDYNEFNVFFSLDKVKIEKWVKRYNSIIENRKNKLKNYNPENYNYDFFLYDLVKWDEPNAFLEKITVI